jgi:two-component sensor histidine kinase
MFDFSLRSSQLGVERGSLPIQRVLTNLFLNALAHAFSDNREGTISIKARAVGDRAVEIIFQTTAAA